MRQRKRHSVQLDTADLSVEEHLRLFSRKKLSESQYQRCLCAVLARDDIASLVREVYLALIRHSASLERDVACVPQNLLRSLNVLDSIGNDFHYVWLADPYYSVAGAVVRILMRHAHHVCCFNEGPVISLRIGLDGGYCLSHESIVIIDIRIQFRLLLRIDVYGLLACHSVEIFCLACYAFDLRPGVILEHIYVSAGIQEECAFIRILVFRSRYSCFADGYRLARSCCPYDLVCLEVVDRTQGVTAVF